MKAIRAKPLPMKHRGLDGVPCHWCGEPMQNRDPHLRPTRDHVIPRSRGGGGRENIVFACFDCNQLKGDMPPEAWNLVRATIPEWRSLLKSTTLRGCRLLASLLMAGRLPPPERGA